MQYVWVILLFLPGALSQYTGRFKVVVPDAPVFSVSGSEVILPCSVREIERPNIRINAVDMNINWSRSDLKPSLVHLYGNHEDLNTDQIHSYRGRTAVFKEELKNGNASLKLSNVRITDEGEYTCRADSKTWENSKTLKLSVEAVGSEAVITVEKYESGKFSLLCESKGWHPEPELQWRNSKGVNLTAETETQPDGDLFNVKSRITIEKIDLYFCTVTQRHHVKEGWIDAQTLNKFVPNPWKTVGIIIGVLLLVGVLAGVVIYKRKKRQKKINEEKRKREEEINAERRKREEEINEEKRKREEEINAVKSLLKSDRDGRLLHHNLSERQWDYVECTLLKSEEDLKVFNLKKYDPSDRGVQKLKNVIASSKKALLKQCKLTEKSCEVLASVLSSENSKLTELDLSLNKLKDSGVEKLFEGLKSSHCKLKILRLEDCGLTGESCADLASVLKSENCKLIELNLSENTELKDSGVEKLCDWLKDKNCKLEKLRLEHCDLGEESCKHLAEVLESGNSKLIELNLSRNRRLEDSGVKKLCDGLKNEHCKLQILRLAGCSITNDGFSALASALIENPSSPLEELDLNGNGLKESELKLLPKLKDKLPKLKVKLDKCRNTDKGCAVLTSALKENTSSPSEEQELLSKLNDTFV